MAMFSYLHPWGLPSSSLLLAHGLCLRSRGLEPTPCLPLFHPAICCRHLFLTNNFKLRNKFAQHHLVYMRISSSLRISSWGWHPDLGDHCQHYSTKHETRPQQALSTPSALLTELCLIYIMSLNFPNFQMCFARHILYKTL